MTIDAGTLRDHLDYTVWASSRLLDAAAAISPEDLERDFGTADRNITGTLAHLFAADRVWLRRVRADKPLPFLVDSEKSLAVLRDQWPPILDGWKSWAAGLDDGAVTRSCAYTDLKGKPWVTPFWQIVLHVVNHATHHRGQVAGFLRSLGHTPPNLDLIAYYRAKAS
jgi:uncharacterized damage-inducible protein DinB